mgnify:CR=1 FL=1
MKKVGICTFYNNNNYGSYLQSFALIEKVKSMGFDSYLIDFADYSKVWNKRLKYSTILNRFKCLLLNPSLLVETIKAKIISRDSILCPADLQNKFKAFSQNYLSFYNDNYIKDDFAAFIVGSDQVWKVTMPGLHQVFFLRFCSPLKRISYAASLGSDEIPNYNKKQLFRYLNEFKAISVREDTAVSLLNSEEYDLNPIQVLDPVLLVGRCFWEQYIQPVCHEKYIFLYFLDSISSTQRQLNKIIAQYPGYKLICAHTGVKIDGFDVEYIMPSPLEFVSLVKNCFAMITDSFHGTAFSIIFDKNFYVLPRNYKIYGGQKDRILSLLRMFNCVDRLLLNPESLSKVKPLDVNDIHCTLTSNQIVSNAFLNDALTNK